MCAWEYQTVRGASLLLASLSMEDHPCVSCWLGTCLLMGTVRLGDGVIDTLHTHAGSSGTLVAIAVVEEHAMLLGGAGWG